jgi:hypothetical protein
VERPQSKWFTGCVVAIFVVAAVIFLAGYPFRPNKAPKISVVATNDATLGSLAVFGVTNESNDSIIFVPLVLQAKSHGAWINMAHVATNMTMAAHAGDTYTAVLTTNHTDWRLQALWLYQTHGQIEYLRGVIKANVYINWQNAMRGQWPQYYNKSMGNSSYIILSPEITN